MMPNNSTNHRRGHRARVVTGQALRLGARGLGSGLTVTGHVLTVVMPNRGIGLVVVQLGQALRNYARTQQHLHGEAEASATGPSAFNHMDNFVNNVVNQQQQQQAFAAAAEAQGADPFTANLEQISNQMNNIMNNYVYNSQVNNTRSQQQSSQQQKQQTTTLEQQREEVDNTISSDNEGNNDPSYSPTPLSEVADVSSSVSPVLVIKGTAVVTCSRDKPSSSCFVDCPSGHNRTTLTVVPPAEMYQCDICSSYLTPGTEMYCCEVCSGTWSACVHHYHHQQ